MICPAWSCKKRSANANGTAEKRLGTSGRDFAMTDPRASLSGRSPAIYAAISVVYAMQPSYDMGDTSATNALIHRFVEALDAAEGEFLILAKRVPEPMRERVLRRPDGFLPLQHATAQHSIGCCHRSVMHQAQVMPRSGDSGELSNPDGRAVSSTCFPRRFLRSPGGQAQRSLSPVISAAPEQS